MKNIVFTRIDDRLIHGQVMTAWVQYTRGNEILIVDDAVAKDEFLKTIMTATTPSGISLHIFSVAEAAEYLKGSDDGKKIILLAKTPATIYGILENGIMLEKLNIGGIGARKDRTKLYRNISATDEERDIFRKIIEKGVNVKVQVIPDDKPVNIGKFL
ncbi:MAG TPA: PTS sugar transporter subunit IIB [Clostridium sp.]